MPTSLHPAVLNCWTAYRQAYAIERGKGVTHRQADEVGAMAYRDVIPCICDRASLRDFITCVAHGMVIRVIPNDDGGKLLYAAQVAAGFLSQEQKMEQKSEQKTVQPAQAPAQQPFVSPTTAAA